MAEVLQWLKIWANAKAISSNQSRGDRGTTEEIILLDCAFCHCSLDQGIQLQMARGVPAIKQKFTLN